MYTTKPKVLRQAWLANGQECPHSTEMLGKRSRLTAAGLNMTFFATFLTFFVLFGTVLPLMAGAAAAIAQFPGSAVCHRMVRCSTVEATPFTRLAVFVAVFFVT